MWTKQFWKRALERAFKAGVNALVLVGGGEAFDVLKLDWKLALAAFASAFALSIGMSVVSSNVGDPESPSLVK